MDDFECMELEGSSKALGAIEGVRLRGACKMRQRKAGVKTLIQETRCRVGESQSEKGEVSKASLMCIAGDGVQIWEVRKGSPNACWDGSHTSSVATRNMVPGLSHRAVAPQGGLGGYRLVAEPGVG